MKLKVIFTAFIILASVLCGCRKSDSGNNTPAENPRDTSRMVMALEAEPKTFDPAYITGVVGMRVASALFEGLTVLHEETLVPEPGAAESWTVSEDGLNYVFTMRESQWSDGTALKADDFVYAWKRVLEPATGADYASMLFAIKGAEAFHRGEAAFDAVGIRAEANQLFIELENPIPYFLHLTSFTTYLPVPRHCIEKIGEQWSRGENLIGNGPFRIERHTMHDRIILKRNPQYYAAESVRLDQLVMRIIENSTAAFDEYEIGKIDLLTDVNPAVYRQIKDSDRNDLHVFTILGIYFIRCNITREPFDDRRVIEALTLAIDNEFLVKHVTGAGELAADGWVPPGTANRPGYTRTRSFDPDKARQLLSEAGYPGGKGFPEIEYMYNTSDMHQMIAEAVSEMLKNNLGIRMVPLNTEWKVYLSRMKALDYDLSRSGWLSDYNEAMTFLDLFTDGNPNNRTGWAHSEFDRNIKNANAAADPVQRAGYMLRAEELLLTEGPVIPLYYYKSKFMFRPEVLGGIYPNMQSWVRPGRLFIRP